MDLILWRHAEAYDAEPGQDDMERALTPKGQKQARRMADWLTSQLPDSCRILVSPALRTLQTVEPLKRKFKIVHDLAPGADPEDVLMAANWPNGREPVLVVGHQPTLGQVAALLLSGQPQDWQIKKANAWWLVQREPLDPYSLYLKGVMAPDLIVK
ncbi:phosphohistidine phosphatase SixA [Massilia sp. P8910]|uniref:Phosphohistidine phosphatase SixA n=1 Tax=Massilia antarctica TaxID=2765360 RepID=A0AA49A622_9BURK|nr:MULTISPECIES: phosphohistidine phosphatase SixA [Massilia]CUI08772.1 Phosphohistidine phosphatase SixA [Janthinobacterium sp. CG23_2]MCE3608287.1 phosphohistidine phosphatase SixA [Massilia antarctica]MCY0910943.1 phosphohistidine phosphatase SixA [Massilia sp. H27-R4]QPI47824.1 phosphohistidine phosphatase SixA [Massilia antarctica]CUU32558.1 Phosphohistidine phosphatase SixA [Janthinobacterium sp. CG23_2]